MKEALDERPGWRDLLIAAVLAALWVALVRPGPLSLPYFWDEADVYVPGARWVAEHGFTITPGVFPDDYSRGHPPLLYLVAALAFRLFGSDPTVGHLVVLPFTVLALVATYMLGATLFGRSAGAAAAVLLATTPLFMSIGNMLLPEIPLTALAALSLLAFARGRLVLAVLAGVAAVWIKETGIFAAAAVGVGVLADAWHRGALRERATLARAALAAAPLAALLGFFAWQKVHAGYFVFPHHQSLFADRPLEWSNALTVGPSLLLWKGRAIVVIGALVALLFGRTERPEESARERWEPARAAVVVACLALVFFNAVFFAKMFWLERYALPAHPGLLVCATGALFSGFGARASAPKKPGGVRPFDYRLASLALRSGRSASRGGRAPPEEIARFDALRSVLAHAPVVAGAIVGLLGMRAAAPPDAEELTFAYADVVVTHRAALAALGEHDEPVLTTWPITVELREPHLGYVDRPLEAIHAAHHGDEPVGSILINTASSHAPALRREAARRGMRRARRFRTGVAPALELYRPARTAP